ncbi:MAG: hypothetical protein N2745_07770 [Syntrophorhabdaceae bacterium]|nr:hypothetical protein [Syntrophorhabdaceae bacterium]
MAVQLEFTTVEMESTFLDPRKGFDTHKERFQIRFDPLTGRSSRFAHFGAITPQPLPLEKYDTPEVKGFCPFCPENRERVTPKFINEIIPEGRLKKKEAMLIPNLFPYDELSGVLIMTERHVVPIHTFTEETLFNAFSLGVEFLKRLKKVSPSHPFHVATWNFMPPSGGGLVHPHHQYFATKYPGNLYMEDLRASEEFFKRHGTSYWEELIEEEKRQNLRYIGEIGDTVWLVPFATLGIFCDIMCIFKGVFSIEEVTEEHLLQLVSGIMRVFEYYHAKGIYSFNASLHFGPEGQRYIPSRFRIIGRTFLNLRDFASDLNFFQALLGEPVSVFLPEAVSEDIKGFFKNK